MTPSVVSSITAATSAGVAVLEAHDNMMLVIDVDPAAVQAIGTDKRYLHLLFTPDANINNALISATAVLRRVESRSSTLAAM